MSGWTEADVMRQQAKFKAPVPTMTPQNGARRSKYRAVPCIVTADLTLFTSEDINRSFKATRGCEPDDEWQRRSLQDRAQAENIIGHWFGSLKEGRRYIELKSLEQRGQIRQLRLQPRYVLCGLVVEHADCRDVNAGTIVNRRSPVADYVGDFEYEESYLGTVWNVIIEDTKGVRTAVYKLKKRLFETQYGISIREV